MEEKILPFSLERIRGYRNILADRVENGEAEAIDFDEALQQLEHTNEVIKKVFDRIGTPNSYQSTTDFAVMITDILPMLYGVVFD